MPSSRQHKPKEIATSQKTRDNRTIMATNIQESVQIQAQVNAMIATIVTAIKTRSFAVDTLKEIMIGSTVGKTPEEELST